MVKTIYDKLKIFSLVFAFVFLFLFVCTMWMKETCSVQPHGQLTDLALKVPITELVPLMDPYTSSDMCIK